MENLLNTHQVQVFFGIGRATVWRWVKTGVLPAPLKFGKGRNAPVRWEVSAILAAAVEHSQSVGV